jgi:hypothetical protein
MSEETEVLQAATDPLAAAADLDERITVNECGSCGGVHERVLLHKYIKPIGPYTHWYSCTTTGDPVPLCLTMIGKSTALEIQAPILRELISALIDTRYLIAVWRVHPDPANPTGTELTLEPPIYREFPTEDPLVGFGAAIGLLERKLTETLGRPIRSTEQQGPAKLPPAGPRIPLVRMFGEQR